MNCWDVTRPHPFRKGNLNFPYFREIHLSDIIICLNKWTLRRDQRAHFRFLLKLIRYCPFLWYKDRMFFPCVFEPVLRRKNILQPPCTAHRMLGIFKCKESPVRATVFLKQCQVGKQDFRTPNMCRTKWDRSEIQLLPFNIFQAFSSKHVEITHTLC